MQAVDCWACANKACSCRITMASRLSDCRTAPRKAPESQTIASPSSWTTAWLNAIFPSSADAMPTAPSLPIIAASVVSPVPSVTTSDTTALVGKYTDRIRSPA